MKKIQIFGGKGQHASDLLKRGIFDNIPLSIIEEYNSFKAISSAVLVPISITTKTIEGIIKPGFSGNIINFSGIMGTTPNDAQNITTNFHFLFGPNSEQGLKVILAGNISNDVTKQIIKNTKNRGISILESSIEEHDKIMAVIQGLTHFFILLSGLDLSGKSKIIKEWKTPPSTITDMIIENYFFEEILNIFINLIKEEKINISKIFLDIVSQNITSLQKKYFGTPTFNRVISFCENNSLTIKKQIIYDLSNKLKDKTIIHKKVVEVQNSV